MNTSINNNDQQQLIPMETISTKIHQQNSIPIEDKSEMKEEKFCLRCLICPMKLFQSIHLPHFSDRSLRLTFLLFITFIGLTSFTIALITGSIVVQFKQQCPLYASFRFQLLKTTTSNWTIHIYPQSERFSSQSTCDFCTFYNVFTFIYCIMTGFFFVLFNGDQRIVTTNDRCLIIPWFPMSTILGLMALINASILTNGFLKLCSTIITNNTTLYSCTQLNQLFFEQYPSVSYLFVYMLVSIIASWLQLIFFIGIIAILTIRLGSSFDWNHTNEKMDNSEISKQ